MATIDTTIELLGELERMDRREELILAALLERIEQLERVTLRERSVTGADLEALQATLDELRAKIARAQAAAATPAATPAPGADGAPSAPRTREQLAEQVREQDARAKQMRELIAERLRALEPAPVAPAAAHGPSAPAPTFRLARPLVRGPGVQAFQRLLNHRFAAWGIARRIAEDGTYGPATSEAAHQVALALGLLAADFEHGITPALRVLVRTPSRRSAAQVQRARRRAPYRAALRRRYATRRPPAVADVAPSAGNGNGNGHVAVAGGVAAAIRAHGGRWEDVVVREAEHFHVPVALVCAVIDVESGFTNVFGHDTVRNPIKSPPRPAPNLVVTEERYREYKRHRKLGEGSQGVGPMQLTFFALQDEADALGGCFVPEINIHVGVKHLASLIDKHGLHDGVQAYNLLGGHGYAELVMKRKRVWDERLGAVHAAPAPRPRPRPRPAQAHATAPKPGALPTFRVRTPPLRSAAVQHLQHDLNERFARWGIGRRIAEDGVYGKQTEHAAHQVALALGLQPAAYAHGVTPQLRVLIRRPSMRTPAQKQRAKERRDYRAKLRKRYGDAGPSSGAVTGSPKAVIDRIVIPIARKNGIDVTPRSVEQANAAHSLLTTSGNRSDHKGPGTVAWAADMSNGGAPTPQMDKLAADLAKRFGIPWSGSGLVTHSAGGYRYQLIYRTNQGGNHFDHVHLGVKKV